MFLCRQLKSGKITKLRCDHSILNYIDRIHKKIVIFITIIIINKFNYFRLNNFILNIYFNTNAVIYSNTENGH